MWTYNFILKCAIRSRSSVLPPAWQRSLLRTSINSFSTAPLRNVTVSTKRPAPLTALIGISIQRQFKRLIHVSKCLQEEVNTNLAKDVVLFKYDNVRLHQAITFFGLVNYLMFMSVSLNIYTILTQKPEAEEGKSSEFDTEKKGSSSFSLSNSSDSVGASSSYLENTGSEESSTAISQSYLLIGLCGVTFVLGILVLAGTYIYCNSAVRYIVLHKGGKRFTVVTHGFAKNRYESWNLDEVTCRGHRTISSAILLNTKGKFFPYIMDKKGVYTNPKLFDATVGVIRDLKKK